MIPSPSPSTVAAVISRTTDINGLIGGSIKALSGGTTTEIISGVFILLVMVFFFFYQSKITAEEQNIANSQTVATDNQVQQNASGTSSAQEGQMANSQTTLLNAEQTALKAMLDGLSDQVLVQEATAAYGAAIAAITGTPVFYPLTPVERQAIYKLYGLP